MNTRHHQAQNKKQETALMSRDDLALIWGTVSDLLDLLEIEEINTPSDEVAHLRHIARVRKNGEKVLNCIKAAEQSLKRGSS